jgi:hypothetical protein
MRLWQASWGTLDAEAYQKNYRREAVSTEYPALMLSNMVDTLGQGFVWLPLTSAGTAQSRGLELALRTHWRSRAQLLLSAARSQTTYRALDGIRRPGNFDTPMAATALGNIRLWKGIQLDLRDSASSGRPTRPSTSPTRSRRAAASTISPASTPCAARSTTASTSSWSAASAFPGASSTSTPARKTSSIAATSGLRLAQRLPALLGLRQQQRPAHRQGRPDGPLPRLQPALRVLTHAHTLRCPYPRWYAMKLRAPSTPRWYAMKLRAPS